MRTFCLSTVLQANLDLAFSSLFICGEKIRNNFTLLYAERGNMKRVWFYLSEDLVPVSQSQRR